jgi:hypothetical protein
MENYVEIDHRESPGITHEEAARLGAIAHCDVVAVGKGQHFKSACITCHGCEKQVILNPDRSRERHYCPTHDAYLCDDCELQRKLSGKCISWWQRIEEAANAFLRKSTGGVIFP